MVDAHEGSSKPFGGIPPLVGENFSSWEKDVERVLKIRKAWRAVRGAPPAANAAQDVRDKWTEACDEAVSTITLCCEPAIRRDIDSENARRKDDGAEEMTAGEIIEFLRTEHQASSMAARLRIRRELAAALNTKGSGGTMRDWLGRIGALYDQLAAVGAAVDTQERVLTLISNLPAAYDALADSYRRQTPTWAELRGDILETEHTIRAREERDAANGQTSTGPGTALAVGQAHAAAWPPSAQTSQYAQGWDGSGRGGPSSGRGRGRGRGGFAPRGRGAFGGFRGGHHGSPQSTTTPQHQHQHQHQPAAPFLGACHSCQQPGHKWRHCPMLPGLQAQAAAHRPGGNGSGNHGQAAMAQDFVLHEDAGDADEEFTFAVGATAGDTDSFVLDSGSSRHIVVSRSALKDYKPARLGATIECANGAPMPIHGFGTLEAVTQEGKTIVLKDVAHCPSAICNLIGGKRITNGGCSILFDKNAAKVINDTTGDLVMLGIAKSGGWVVNLRAKKDITAAVGDERIDPAAVKAHQALGHANINVLRSVARAGLVPELPKILGSYGFCSACAQGKLHRNPHPRTLGQAQRAMELTHVDLFGPVRVKDEQAGAALGGFVYGMIIVDDYTKHLWVRLLRSKGEAAQALKQFHLTMSAQLPHVPISRVRTDGALEFQRADLHDFWLKHGVTHEVSPRYTPQSNGTAERNVRTVVEMVRTALMAAQLPGNFWPAAAENAARIKNRIAAAGLSNGTTPHEALFGARPPPEPLHPFGCVAWAGRPEAERNGKFDAKARPCIFLGYAFTGGARLWDPRTRKIVVEHSVVFDDARPGGELWQASEDSRRAAVGEAMSAVAVPIAGGNSGTQQANPTPQPQERRARATAETRQVLSRALLGGAVPGDIRARVEEIVAGQEVTISAWAAVRDRLQSFADNAQRRAQAQRETEGVGDARRPRQPADTGGAPRDELGSGAEEPQQRAPAEARTLPSERQGTERAAPAATFGGGSAGGSSEQAAGSIRHSRRLAGEAPQFGPMTGEKRKAPDGCAVAREIPKLFPPRSRGRGAPDPDNGCFFVLDPCEPSAHDPKTVNEAMTRPDRQAWLDAMHVEVKAHLQRGTWRTVKAQGKLNIISAKWVFRLKKNADGSIQKYKARLVARGFTQVYGVDYDETFAPTSRTQNMRLLAAMCAVLGLDLHQIDFETAYLNAKLKNDIHMLPPEGMDLLGQHYGPDDVLELKLALYGLKQSGHEWHAVLSAALKSIGFEQAKGDPTMFVRGGDKPAILMVYVDDILVAAPPGGGIEAVKGELLKLFRGTDLGPAHHCLGIRISRSWEDGTIALDQERYAEEVLARFGMSECKPAKTPMEAKASLRKATEGEARADVSKYQAIVGSLAYLAQGTRPDIAYAVSSLGKFNADPTETHMIAAKRVLRYLRGTTGAKLTFGGEREDGTPTGTEPRGFVDADWAADRDDRRSVSGFVFTMAGGAVSWGSRKQGAVALSTAEAEYIAAGVAGREALMISGALSAAGKSVGAITIRCDNQAAIHLVKNPGSHHDRSKHIDIVHHWIRDKTQEGAFAFQYIPTDVNPADAFTKPLGQAKHQEHAQRIGLALALGAWRGGREE